MKSLREECTKEDVVELRKLILEYPDLPLLVFRHDDIDGEDYNYVQADDVRVFVEEVTKENGDWISKDELEEQMLLCLEDETSGMTNKELYEMIQEKMKRKEFIRAIVMYVI